MAKYYINYRCQYDGTIETIEELDNWSECKYLITEYKLVSSAYYVSKRATKDYYATQKQSIINSKV